MRVGVELRYVIAGIINTLISIISFPFIYEKIFNGNLFTLAYLIAAILNIGISFLVQRFYVFESTGKFSAESLRFGIGALALSGIGYVGNYILAEMLRINTYISNFFIVIFVAILSYVWHKNLTFK